MEGQQPWHRLFGLTWMDFFRGLPVTVELEKDLSIKKQLLDVVILRKQGQALPCALPDGFDDLGPHNLVSFKSYQDSLDGWALLELLGHYVNYRKQVSPSMQDLLPPGDFRLFAVCVRFPAALKQEVALTAVQDGVYDVSHFTGKIRVVVVHQLPQQQHNAMLHLFSAQSELVRYGAENYRQHSDETSTLLEKLFRKYKKEGVAMADVFEQFIRETRAEILSEMSPEERLRGISPDDLRKHLPPEERLKGLSADDLLAALPPEVREALARRLKEQDSSAKQE